MHAIALLTFVAEMVPTEQAPAPEAAPAEVPASIIRSAFAELDSDSSCAVVVQEQTVLCEALPGYLADMSHCIAPPQNSTWRLSG